MPRFYFDIHDDQGLWPDEEGYELPDLRAAQREAALSLVEIAHSEIPDKQQHRVSVRVRTAEGLLFEAAFIFEMKEFTRLH
jgi:uncharacterized protein DUF6894